MMKMVSFSKKLIDTILGLIPRDEKSVIFVKNGKPFLNYDRILIKNNHDGVEVEFFFNKESCLQIKTNNLPLREGDTLTLEALGKIKVIIADV